MLLLVCIAGQALAQGPTGAASPSAAVPDAQTANASAKDVPLEIDRVVAIVNGDLILESDVDEERRFAAFQPYSIPDGRFSRAEAIERLIDRRLILQQAQESPQHGITDAMLDANLAELKKDIPPCRVYDCITPEGWSGFLKLNGFTEEELRARWRERMQTLAFIEQRFRMGIRISREEQQTYYDKTLLPQYALRGAAAPPFASIRARIQEILLEQQVTALLDDWLKTLRASGSVRMIPAGEISR